MVKRVTWLACAAALAAAPLVATGQNFPNKPIRMVLSVGGGAEVAARMLAQRLNIGLGQQVLAEVQTGAGGMMGAETVARAAPDGYTILYASASTHVFAIHLSKNVRYDPIKDFTAITRVFGAILCIAAGPAAPAGSLKELIDYARLHPGKVSYATSGIGTGQHLAAELIKLLTGTDMVHVPYKSGAQATTDLVGGQIPISFGVFATAAPYLKSGKLKILAIIDDKRYQGVPDAPAVREVVPGFEAPPTWTGFFGPAGLPQPVLKRLHEEIVKSVSAPDIAAKLDDIGFAVRTDAPGEFATVIKQNIELVGRIAKSAGIQPE